MDKHPRQCGAAGGLQGARNLVLVASSLLCEGERETSLLAELPAFGGEEASASVHVYVSEAIILMRSIVVCLSFTISEIARLIRATETSR